jgi:hypothetical protein
MHQALPYDSTRSSIPQLLFFLCRVLAHPAFYYPTNRNQSLGLVTQRVDNVACSQVQSPNSTFTHESAQSHRQSTKDEKAWKSEPSSVYGVLHRKAAVNHRFKARVRTKEAKTGPRSARLLLALLWGLHVNGCQLPAVLESRSAAPIRGR